MQLRPLRARLTAGQAELILADANHFLDLCPYSVVATDLGGRQRQAIGGVVLLAVSDNAHFQPPAQSADLRPIWVAPMVTERRPVEPAIFLEAAHEVPSIVTNPLQQRFRRIPGVKEHILRVTMQAIPSIAEQLQCEVVLRGPPLRQRRRPSGIRPTPSVHTSRTSEKP
jgi:hypothetical protein